MDRLEEGQGKLFQNRDKKQDNHPDLEGKALIDGKLYRVAGWKGRNEFVGLRFNKIEKKKQQEGEEQNDIF